MREIFNSSPKLDFEIANLKENPLVFCAVFRDMIRQDQTLSRLAYYAEQSETKGHVLTDKELSSRSAHVYDAHDYPLRKIAEFFNQAATEHVQLNADEESFRTKLLESQVLSYDKKNGYLPNLEGFFISFPSDFPETEKEYVVRHEYIHAIYHT